VFAASAELYITIRMEMATRAKTDRAKDSQRLLKISHAMNEAYAFG